MSINASRVPPLRKTATSNRNLIMIALTGTHMILLAHFVPDGTIVGMFDVWGISLVSVAVGGYLLLRLWGVYG